MEKKKSRKSKERLFFSEKERAELRAKFKRKKPGDPSLEFCNVLASEAREDSVEGKGHPLGLCYHKYTELVGAKDFRLSSQAQADEFGLFFGKVMRSIKKCKEEGDVNADAVWDFLLYGGKAPWDKAQSDKKEK